MTWWIVAVLLSVNTHVHQRAHIHTAFNGNTQRSYKFLGTYKIFKINHFDFH